MKEFFLKAVRKLRLQKIIYMFLTPFFGRCFKSDDEKAEKILEDYNEVFADIINVLIFNGEQRVKPDSLVTNTTRSQYKADDDKLHEQERDVSKTWKECNIELALYGLENQTAVEKMMPLRIAGYEGASYRSQFQKNVKKAVPVVTLVLYFGKDHWTKPKSLKELMDIPDGLDEYINDCKIHVFEISWLTDEQVSKFKSDFKVVANFFTQKRKNENYVPDDTTEIKHVDEVLKLLHVMTGDNSYEEILNSSKGKVKNMCEVAERLKKIGHEEAMKNLIVSMLEDGKTAEEISNFCKIDLQKIKEIESDYLR